MLQKINSYLPFILIGLIIYSGISTYKLIEVSQQTKSLEAAHKILEKNFQNQQKNITTEFDSIEKAILFNNQFISELHFDLIELDKRKVDINTKSNENKDRINRITNADSLVWYITRRYR